MANNKNGGNGKASKAKEFPMYPPIQHCGAVGDLLRTTKAVCEVLDACGIDSEMETQEAEDLMMGCRGALLAAIRGLEKWGDDPENDYYVVYSDHPLHDAAWRAISELGRANAGAYAKQQRLALAA